VETSVYIYLDCRVLWRLKNQEIKNGEIEKS